MSKKMFDIKPQILKTPEQAFADIIGGAKDNQIVEIPLELIDEIDNQPQHIHDDKIARIVESMKIVGQLDPIIVVPNKANEGRYLLLAGRHRCRACKALNLVKVKAVIKQEDNQDKQRLMLLATNNDRNTDYAPSELAFSYLEQKQLLEKFGSRSTASKIAEENNTNRKTVHKYIQLTKLNKSLLYKVDNGDMTVGAGYELSFLPEKDQQRVNVYLINHPDCKIDKNIARMIRNEPENLDEIFTVDGADEKDNEKPKAEKKNKNNSKCPSEGQLQELTNEQMSVIGAILYEQCYSIFTYIVSEFSSTDDVIEFIKTRYANSKYADASPKINVGIDKYKNASYSLSFSKTVNVTIQVNQIKEQYSLKLKTVDSIVRRYIRKELSRDDIILMLKR